MAFIFHEDALCSVCNRHTTFFCEGCHTAICEEHTHNRKLSEFKSSMNCPDCIKKPIHKLRNFV